MWRLTLEGLIVCLSKYFQLQQSYIHKLLQKMRLGITAFRDFISPLGQPWENTLENVSCNLLNMVLILEI